MLRVAPETALAELVVAAGHMAAGWLAAVSEQAEEGNPYSFAEAGQAAGLVVVLAVEELPPLGDLGQ